MYELCIPVDSTRKAPAAYSEHGTLSEILVLEMKEKITLPEYAKHTTKIRRIKSCPYVCMNIYVD